MLQTYWVDPYVDLSTSYNNTIQHLTCWNSPCHGEWASMASIPQGRGKGKNAWAKTWRMHHFFLYCPLSHSLSNAYHTGCHERVSSSIGHRSSSSFSQIIHIKLTVELAVYLTVQLLVLCVRFVKMSSYHHILYYCQWEWGRDIKTSTFMPVKLWHCSEALYWRMNIMIQVLKVRDCTWFIKLVTQVNLNCCNFNQLQQLTN